MAKVLYIGHLHERSGWSNASYNYIRAMKSVGIDVVCRSVVLGNRFDPPDDIKPLLSLKNDCDILIQHVLPNFLDYNGNYKNIAIAILESKGVNYKWAEKLNLMDEIWTPYPYDEPKLKVKQNVVPHACNVFDYRFYERVLPPGYYFYTIADFCKRKNLATLIKAFHLAFPPHIPVNLVLKVTKSGLSPKDTLNSIGDMIKKVKEGLKLYPLDKYKSEIIITDYIDKLDLMRLHSSCNCYVSCSYGECWDQPLFDAMVLGRSIIAPNHTVYPHYLYHYDDKYLIESKETNCFGAVDHLSDIYTGREIWWEVDLDDLIQAMQTAYQIETNYLENIHIGRKIGLNYSYPVIGQRIKELLCQNIE